MYTYFFLAAINAVPKNFNPFYITCAQISQMFVGIFITISQVGKRQEAEKGFKVADSHLDHSSPDPFFLKV